MANPPKWYTFVNNELWQYNKDKWENIQNTSTIYRKINDKILQIFDGNLLFIITEINSPTNPPNWYTYAVNGNGHLNLLSYNNDKWVIIPNTSPNYKNIGDKIMQIKNGNLLFLIGEKVNSKDSTNVWQNISSSANQYVQNLVMKGGRKIKNKKTRKQKY